MSVTDYNFLQAECPSCQPTNSIKAMKGWICDSYKIRQRTNMKNTGENTNICGKY